MTRRQQHSGNPARAEPRTGAPLVALLAAGRARRFGGGKLDAMLAGRRVGAHVLAAVAQADLPPGVAIVGDHVPAFLAEAAPGWRCVENPEAASGLASSLARAARAARDCGAPALLVLLADMPLVTAAHLAALAGRTTLTATRHPDRRAGVPALFPSGAYAGLERLTGDRGAGPLLRDAAVALIEPPPGLLLDIDRAEDLARAEALLAAR